MRSRSGEGGRDRGHAGHGGAERGSITAEFAAAVPAVLLLLACCLAGVQIAGQQVRLQDAAADVSRSVARGGGTAAAAQVGASVAVAHRGDLVCATLSARSRSVVGGVLSLTLTASSCALGEGR
jgi:Flp pilus assembly protein TadG